jgi:hypothetical protein
MSTQKKTKKTFFSKWGKRGKMADGLSTTFFELKLNSSPQELPPDPLKPELETVTEQCKENVNDCIKMEAPLHLINVIV